MKRNVNGVEEDIPENEAIEIQAEWDANETLTLANKYRRDREVDLPSIGDQFDMQYWDIINGTTLWVDMITANKAAHPKPV